MHLRRTLGIGRGSRRVIAFFAVSALVMNVAFVSVAGADAGWQNAVEVTSSVTGFNANGSDANTISCASTGNCSAGGEYSDGTYEQSYVVDEVNGTWGSATEVTSTTITGFGTGYSYLYSISCASAGNCAAAGYYYTAGEGEYDQAFVVDEVNGTWGSATEVTSTTITGFTTGNS